MKVIGNFFKGILLTVWLVVAIFVTICLIAYNDFAVSEFGDYSMFVVDNQYLEPTFHKFDILIVKKGISTEYKVGEPTFFYNNNEKYGTFINLGEITDIQYNEKVEDNFYFDGDTLITFDNIIGHANNAIVIKKLGILLSVLENRWGFLLLVILPCIYLVVYEIYNIVYEVKKNAKIERKRLEEEEKGKNES